MKNTYSKIIFLLAVIVLISPNANIQATEAPFEVSAWIPYWRSKEGVANILPQLDKFKEVNPFVYSVRQDGTLYENSPLTDEEWVNLKIQAKQKGINFIPTIMWANADAIDATLRDPAKRQEHIRAIVKEVYSKGFDGIDIDYEAKHARTKYYFSLFLKGLYEAIEYDKLVMCTIEARTPLDSRYETPEAIPKDIEYANDFAEINKYCDRVRIMAYDQGRIDLKLNKLNTDHYAPVADRAWVEKVLELAIKDINKEKITIGVPTYGYEYDVFDAMDGSGKKEYSRLWSFNPNYAIETGGKLNIAPARNSAGELSLIYPASKSPDPVIPLPNATRLMSWSDAEAIRQKAELAEKLGLRGIAIFKIDGGQDPLLWNVLSVYKDKKVIISETAPSTTGSSGASGSTGIKSLNRDLSLGMRVGDVRTLQKYLNSKGFIVSAKGGGSIGNETTYFGPATKSALIHFQKFNGIFPASGYFGPLTRAKIKSI